VRLKYSTGVVRVQLDSFVGLPFIINSSFTNLLSRVFRLRQVPSDIFIFLSCTFNFLERSEFLHVSISSSMKEKYGRRTSKTMFVGHYNSTLAYTNFLRVRR
jgi:hypothetical protein